MTARRMEQAKKRARVRQEVFDRSRGYCELRRRHDCLGQRKLEFRGRTVDDHGHMVPVTPLGRMVGGCVMIGGLGTISLLAGILATGFAAELRRSEFLRSWDMISKVSFFESAGAATAPPIPAQSQRVAELPARRPPWQRPRPISRRAQAGGCYRGPRIRSLALKSSTSPKTRRAECSAWRGTSKSS